jgi:acetyltransferase
VVFLPQLPHNNKEEMKHMMTQKLVKLFSPDSVAVIGASNSFDKLGYHVMKSLVGHYAGKIYPINPKGGKVWNLDSYASIGKVPGNIDLAIIVVPAALVPETLHQCGGKGVKGAVLITAGFREIEDSQGGVLQEQIRKYAINTSCDHRPQYIRFCQYCLRD